MLLAKRLYTSKRSSTYTIFCVKIYGVIIYSLLHATLFFFFANLKRNEYKKTNPSRWANRRKVAKPTRWRRQRFAWVHRSFRPVGQATAWNIYPACFHDRLSVHVCLFSLSPVAPPKKKKKRINLQDSCFYCVGNVQFGSVHIATTDDSLYRYYCNSILKIDCPPNTMLCHVEINGRVFNLATSFLVHRPACGNAPARLQRLRGSPSLSPASFMLFLQI